jgi:hypothetical protein
VGLEQLLDFGAPHFGAATLYARAGDDGALTKPLRRAERYRGRNPPE